MRTVNTIKKKFTHVVFFFLIIFLGCSIKETVKNAPDEDILRERVMAYWGYKINEEFDKAYEFEYPLYKKSTTMVSYLRHLNPNFHWRKCEIDAVRIAEDVATVDLKMTNQVALHTHKSPRSEFEFKDVVVKEQWIKVDGIWYHVPKNFKQAK